MLRVKVSAWNTCFVLNVYPWFTSIHYETLLILSWIACATSKILMVSREEFPKLFQELIARVFPNDSSIRHPYIDCS